MPWFLRTQTTAELCGAALAVKLLIFGSGR